MYDLSATLGLDPLSPGSAILVSGPTRSEQERLVEALLSEAVQNGEGAIAVTTEGDGSEWTATLEENATRFGGHTVGAVDCRGDGERTGTVLSNGAFRYSVGDATDLTGIGIGITNCFDRLRETDADGARLGLTSLSTVLDETDRKTTFKFCHVLASRLDSAGYLGVFTIDAESHSEQTNQVLEQAFDGRVDVRKRDRTREARVRGIDGEDTEWHPV